MEIITSAAAVATAVGGLELIKFLFNRRSERRLAATKASVEEFHALREYNEFLQKQLLNSDRRVADKTAMVRRLNAELLKVTREKSLLDAEFTMKRCEVKNCSRRRPRLSSVLSTENQSSTTKP